ncbi:hypothetical protein WJX74_003236 [Apatococcus lobatus]|uniref:Polyprotein n=1 Tax=Apatococcus lobatus TaxID=904363 RepID=A0AAW1QNQ8_9CHLO
MLVPGLPHQDVLDLIGQGNLNTGQRQQPLNATTLLHDSGASHSMMSETQARRLQLFKHVQRTNTKFYTSSGKLERPVGILTDVPISIGTLTLPTDVYVSHADSYNLLIGNNFLAAAEAQIHYGTRELCRSQHQYSSRRLCQEQLEDTGTQEPIKQRPYRLSKHEEEIVDAEVQKWLQQGIVEPSQSPWASPVVLVPKKKINPDDPNEKPKYRLCIDYRALNKAAALPLQKGTMQPQKENVLR